MKSKVIGSTLIVIFMSFFSFSNAWADTNKHALALEAAKASEFYSECMSKYSACILAENPNSKFLNQGTKIHGVMMNNADRFFAPIIAKAFSDNFTDIELKKIVRNKKYIASPAMSSKYQLAKNQAENVLASSKRELAAHNMIVLNEFFSENKQPQDEALALQAAKTSGCYTEIMAYLDNKIIEMTSVMYSPKEAKEAQELLIRETVIYYEPFFSRAFSEHFTDDELKMIVESKGASINSVMIGKYHRAKFDIGKNILNSAEDYSQRLGMVALDFALRNQPKKSDR